MDHLTGALAWWDGGMSVVPVRADGTKRPLGEWTQYQKIREDRRIVEAWFRATPSLGVGVICGKVSGNLEMLELEGRATDSDSLDKIEVQMEVRGVLHVWRTLMDSGYMESTPSGGLHFLYRITDHEVPGNTKIARRPATADELADNPTDRVKVLAETRGEGGFVVVAPTSGTVHKTGDSWSAMSGQIGTVPNLTWEVRCLLHEAIRDALDDMPARELPERPQIVAEPRSGLAPGDDYNRRTHWADLLVSYGWSYESARGREQFWTRPGKDPREGASATLYYQGSDNLYVFSSSTELPTEEPISKFAFYTFMEHRGDFSAAARALHRAGYGERSSIDISDWFEEAPVDAPSRMGAVVEPQAAAVEGSSEAEAQKMIKLHEHTETGVAELAERAMGNRYRSVSEEKGWRKYQDGVWVPSKRSEVQQDMQKLTRVILEQAQAALAEVEDSDDKEVVSRAKRFVQFTSSCRSDRGAKAVVNRFGVQKKISKSVDDFDTNRKLICFSNGTINLDDMNFRAHSPEDMLTKSINIAYDPEAKAKEFLDYLDTVLPDPEFRAYLQRAAGMSLLADMRDAAFFVLHGPTGCGKSVFLNIMSAVFGDYAATAAPGTFKATRGKGDDGYELHQLRGARFASMSETSEMAQLDEELIKRVTGGDNVTSRAPYQDYITWKPRFTMWMATNFKPNLNAGDGAIWRRVKLIEFPVSFYAGDRVADTGLTQRILDNELSGVVNWLLEGVAEYQRIGLGDPQAMRDALEAHRAEVDPVNQFLTEMLAEEVLVEDEDSTVTSATLYRLYADWCRENGLKALGRTRFGVRMDNLGFQATRGTAGVRLRSGLRHNTNGWIVGHR